MKQSAYQFEMTKKINDIKKAEGRRPHAYLDPKGIPTIGYGYALANEHGIFYSKDSINADLNRASGTKGVEYFTDQDMRQMRLARSDKDLKNVGPTLSESQMNRLVEMKVESTVSHVDSTLQALGVDAASLPSGVRGALIDQSYRGGDNLFGKESPTLNGALVRGDLAGVIIEIKYGSNADDQFGNDVRNDKLVKEIWDSLTPEQQKQVQVEIDKQMQTPRNKRLEEKYQQRQKNHKSSDKSKQSSSQTPHKSAGDSVFVHPYERRTGHVGEHYRGRPDGDPSNNFASSSRGQSHGQANGFREPTEEEKKRMPKGTHVMY